MPSAPNPSKSPFSKSSRPPNPNGVASNFFAVLGGVKVRIFDELRKATSDRLFVQWLRKGAHVLNGLIDRGLQRLPVLGSVSARIIAVRFKLLLMQ